MLPSGTVVAALAVTPEAEAFVRFCYQRRHVGWPELYDEMCLVATRGLFRGMGREALSEVGVGFSLFETARMAQVVRQVVGEELAARRAARAAALDIARIAEEREHAARVAATAAA
jgi:hypothetical protein